MTIKTEVNMVTTTGKGAAREVERDLQRSESSPVWRCRVGTNFIRAGRQPAIEEDLFIYLPDWSAEMALDQQVRLSNIVKREREGTISYG